VLRIGPVVRRLRRADGFSLPELLIALMIGLLVVGTGVMMFTTAIRSQPGTSDRLAKVRDARSTSERIVRELRQGWGTTTATSSQLSFLTYVHSAPCGGASGPTATPCRVTYACSAGSCTRTEAQPNGSSPGPTRTVTTGLSGNAVFSYSPSSAEPTWVGITLAFPATNGDDAVTVEDGAALRNPGSAS
jgi:prepilin-type N-terminal cleavage/methylation domain-containing protein